MARFITTKGALILVIFSCQLSHAIPGPQSKEENKKPAEINKEALEILGLPAANRKQVALGKDRAISDSFYIIAFDDNQSMQIRWKALTLASEVGGLESLPRLRQTLTHKHWFMRNAALVAINNLSRQEGHKAAFELIDDKALVVRSAAVTALDSKLSEQERGLLWEELESDINFRKRESLWVRGQILEKLSEIPKKTEAPLFLRYLNDKDKRLHKAAVAGLEKITGKPADNIPNSLRHKIDFWQKWSKTEEAKSYL